MNLPVLYQDDYIIAINKPHGLLVHRSPIATNTDEFAVQILRNQIDKWVYPAHRLDRKTGGVLLFALNEEINKALQQLFYIQQINKVYNAIVRGFTKDEGEINYPLKKDDGTIQEAITRYKTIAQSEIDVSFGKHATSRYSLVEVYPETGRMHQIRKHFAHIFHPIIGDRPHGCNKQNKLFKEKWNMQTMLLHASELSFIHPVSQEKIIIKAPIQEEFNRMVTVLKLSSYGSNNKIIVV
jgi:tRNA pseudouridine65 synthase